MKRLFALVIGICCITYSATAENKTAKIRVKTSIYCDHCEKCESCGKRLEEAVYSVKGVKRVDLDVKNNQVDVVYNSLKTNTDRIRQAIAKVGFDADDVKGNTEEYDKWDNCCKKQ